MTVCGIKQADGVCVMGECPYIKKCCPVFWDKRKSEPMTKEIKIKCDDCKFVEDCVDYGWQDCRKFTPKPSEPMTNEEYLRTANVNDMARCIATKLLELARHEYGIYDVVDYATIFEWLREIHKE